MPTPTPSKLQLLAALAAFVAQRSGIDRREYGGDREAFAGDYRPILRYGRHARAMLAAVLRRDCLTAEDLLAAADRAYAGRLQFVTRPDGKVAVSYTTGQYFPTEYRAAACAVLACALRTYWGADAARIARRELGRGIAREWFN